jgi:outer membrane biosynthesis protein TonB
MTNQGLFMSIMSNILPKITLSLIVTISAVAYAEGDSQKDRFAALKAAPDGEVPVIKMDDIKAGKYSPKKIEKVEKETTTDVETKKKENVSPPVSSPKPSKPVQKKAVKKPKKTIEKRVKKPVKKRVKKATIKPVAKAPVKKAPVKAPVKKQVRRANTDADILSAYKALMGTATTKKTAAAASSRSTATTKASLSRNNRTAGWLYLGKFKQGQWDNKSNQTLGLNANLPRIGQPYTIRLYSNIRSGYPSKGGMPAVIKVLNKGNKVRVLAVHNSRQSGHYWAKIAW